MGPEWCPAVGSRWWAAGCVGCPWAWTTRTGCWCLAVARPMRLGWCCPWSRSAGVGGCGEVGDQADDRVADLLARGMTAPESLRRGAGSGRARSAQVVLDLAGRAQRRLVGAAAGLLQGAALPQQIPALVELDLHRVEAFGVVMTVELAVATPSAQRLLLLDQALGSGPAGPAPMSPQGSFRLGSLCPVRPGAEARVGDQTGAFSAITSTGSTVGSANRTPVFSLRAWPTWPERWVWRPESSGKAS